MAKIETNKFGLSRASLTAEVKRRIRQKSGFGCVMCGIAIGDYEHVDPEFSEAKEHDPERMTFLCSRHHTATTRKRLDKETIRQHMADPFALRKGFSFEELYIGTERPSVVLGDILIENARVIIKHNNEPIFWIDEPEEAGGPFRVNAELRNKYGEVVLSIKDNEWQVRTDNWDVENIGPRTIIRNGKRDIALILLSEPPNRVIVEKMNMRVDGFTFICDGKRFFVETEAGTRFYGSGAHLLNCDCAISHENGGITLGIGCERVTAKEIVVGGDLAKGPAPKPVPPDMIPPVGLGAPIVKGALWDLVRKTLEK